MTFEITQTKCEPIITELQLGRVQVRWYRGAPVFGIELYSLNYYAACLCGWRMEVRIQKP